MGSWAKRTRIGVAAAAAAAMTLGGCASAGAQARADAPEWFAEATAENDERGFPDLTTVPEGARVRTDEAGWSTLAADLIAARDSLRASPRAQPPAADAAQDADSFRAEAIEEILETRRRY